MGLPHLRLPKNYRLIRARWPAVFPGIGFCTESRLNAQASSMGLKTTSSAAPTHPYAQVWHQKTINSRLISIRHYHFGTHNNKKTWRKRPYMTIGVHMAFFIWLLMTALNVLFKLIVLIYQNDACRDPECRKLGTKIALLKTANNGTMFVLAASLPPSLCTLFQDFDSPCTWIMNQENFSTCKA